jgi:hypothetical protein
MEHGVDLWLGGHVHAYHRSWPTAKGRAVRRNFVDPAAPIHILDGVGAAMIMTNTQCTARVYCVMLRVQAHTLPVILIDRDFSRVNKYREYLLPTVCRA